MSAVVVGLVVIGSDSDAGTAPTTTLAAPSPGETEPGGADPESPGGPVATGAAGPAPTLPLPSIGLPNPATGLPPGAPPSGLGADPALDALAQRCYVGDMGACDDLYFAAPGNSKYLAYGDTCARRQPENTGVTCAVVFADAPSVTSPD